MLPPEADAAGGDSAAGRTNGSAAPGAPTAHASRIAGHRTAHRALVAHHLEALRGRFWDLAGCDPPDEFKDRGGLPPAGRGGALDHHPAPDLLSDVRRTEWAAYGLESILQSYAGRAAESAELVRGARDALREWAALARTDA